MRARLRSVVCSQGWEHLAMIVILCNVVVLALQGMVD
jgi:hypothetical protein